MSPPLVSKLLGRAEIALTSSDAKLAERLGREAMQVLARLDSYWNVSWCYEVLARVAVVRRDWERAARLFGACTAIQERAGIVAPPVARPVAEAAIATARAAIGEERFAAVWKQGKIMARDAANISVVGRISAAGRGRVDLRLAD